MTKLTPLRASTTSLWIFVCTSSTCSEVVGGRERGGGRRGRGGREGGRERGEEELEGEKKMMRSPSSYSLTLSYYSRSFPSEDFSRWSTFSEREASIARRNSISSSLCLISSCSAEMCSSVLLRNPCREGGREGGRERGKE